MGLGAASGIASYGGDVFASACFAGWLAPLRAYEWGVYAKDPFAGPEAVLAYL